MQHLLEILTYSNRNKTKLPMEQVKMRWNIGVLEYKNNICDLLREKGPTAVKRHFKTQLTTFSL